MPSGGAHAVEDARLHDGDRVVPVLVRHVLCVRTDAADPRVVDDDVDLTEVPDDGLERRVDLAAVGDVGRVRTRLHTEPCQLFCCASRRVGIDLRDRNPCACAGQLIRDAAAETRACAGHERDPPFKHSHGQSPLRVGCSALSGALTTRAAAMTASMKSARRRRKRSTGALSVRAEWGTPFSTTAADTQATPSLNSSSSNAYPRSRITANSARSLSRWTIVCLVSGSRSWVRRYASHASGGARARRSFPADLAWANDARTPVQARDANRVTSLDRREHDHLAVTPAAQMRRLASCLREPVNLREEVLGRSEVPGKRVRESPHRRPEEIPPARSFARTPSSTSVFRRW